MDLDKIVVIDRENKIQVSMKLDLFSYIKYFKQIRHLSMPLLKGWQKELIKKPIL